MARNLLRQAIWMQIVIFSIAQTPTSDDKACVACQYFIQQVVANLAGNPVEYMSTMNHWASAPYAGFGYGYGYPYRQGYGSYGGWGGGYGLDVSDSSLDPFIFLENNATADQKATTNETATSNAKKSVKKGQNYHPSLREARREMIRVIKLKEGSKSSNRSVNKRPAKDMRRSHKVEKRAVNRQNLLEVEAESTAGSGSKGLPGPGINLPYHAPIHRYNLPRHHKMAANSGLIHEAYNMLDNMCQDHMPLPYFEHCGALLRLWGDVGKLIPFRRPDDICMSIQLCT
eukprot:jgi/Bigna1/73505/fgenesh1_pg.24_\